MALQVEHFAVNVEDPVAMAAWYSDHLEMKVLRSGGPPANTHFLADGSGRLMLEIYRALPDEVPDYAAMNPLLLHIAFASDDAQTDHDRLVAAGATVLGGVDRSGVVLAGRTAHLCWLRHDILLVYCGGK